MSATGKRAAKRVNVQAILKKELGNRAQTMLDKINARLKTDYIKTHFKKHLALLKRKAFYENLLVGAMR